MTSTTRKKVLIGAGGIVGLLIVVLLALPSLIDLNARKPEITAMVKKVTGRDLVLDGPIALSILPTPTVTLSGVKFFNVPGSKNPNMVEVKTVTVKPSLGALLTGILVNPALGGVGIMDYTTGKIADYEFVTQVIAQCKAVLTTLVWSGVVSFILYKVVDILVGLREPVDREREGLDITDHGERAYTM